jgi:hypothetical protein
MPQVKLKVTTQKTVFLVVGYTQFNDVRQKGIHASAPLVPGPSALESGVVIEIWKGRNYQVFFKSREN